jgi:hypothetical protein
MGRLDAELGLIKKRVGRRETGPAGEGSFGRSDGRQPIAATDFLLRI